MKPEIEIRFYGIDKDQLRTKLKNINAKMIHPEHLMKRIIYNIPKTNVNRWLRVREEHGTTTITLKENHNINRIDGIHELEITVNDYTSACNLISALGFKNLAYQESLRETWQLNTTLITLDTWPHLKPLIEIEGPTKEHVHTICTLLGYDSSSARKGTIKTLYIEECGWDAKTFDTKDLLFKK